MTQWEPAGLCAYYARPALGCNLVQPLSINGFQRVALSPHPPPGSDAQRIDLQLPAHAPSGIPEIVQQRQPARYESLQQRARARFDEHLRWMIRSFALTFAAVTLRLYLPFPPMMGFTFVEGYRAIAWLAWVPNLIAAELYWRREPARRLQPAE